MASMSNIWSNLLLAANPWWQAPHQVQRARIPRQPRPFLRGLLEALAQSKPLVLHGPKGAGKSVLVHHAIQSLLAKGLPPGNVCYLPAEHPGLIGIGPQALIDHWTEQCHTITSDDVPRYLFLDEVRADDWQKPHKPGLVPIMISSLHPQVDEQVARLYLPPLTFSEFCATQTLPIGPRHEAGILKVDSDLLQLLDLHLGNYLTPENYSLQAAFDLDLLERALPGYEQMQRAGVASRQDLGALLLTLAQDNGRVTSPEHLTKMTGLAKNTISKYLSFLEDAQLLRRLHRISRWGGRLKRARTFRIFLTLAFMPCVLRGTHEDEETLSRAAIGALLAQMPLARSLVEHPWTDRGLGLAKVGPKRKVQWAMELTYRDEDLQPEGLVGFCRIHQLDAAIITTRTRFERLQIQGVTLNLVPLALQAYVLGYRASWGRGLTLAWRE